MRSNGEAGFCQKNMPKVGVALSLTASIASSFISIVAIQLIANEAGSSAGTGPVIGIIGSLLFIIVNTVVYCFSNARSDLANLGRKLDSCGNDPRGNCQELTNIPRPTCQSSSYIAIQVLFTGVALTATAIDTVTRYKEGKLLEERARQSNTIIPPDVIGAAVVIQAITNGISEFTVFNSFMNLAANASSRYLLNNEQSNGDQIDQNDERANLAQAQVS